MYSDYYGTFIRVQIRKFGSKDEEPIELWINSGYPDIDDMPIVQQVQVVTRLGLNSEISVTLTPPFEDGIKFLNSDLVRWGVGHLSVTFGYTTGSADRSPPWSGLMMSPEVNITGSEITITLKAVGVGYPMSVAGSVESKDYTGMTVNSIAEDVLKKYAKSKLFVLDEDKLYPDFNAAEKNKETGHPFFRIPQKIIQGVPASSRSQNADESGTARYKSTNAQVIVEQKQQYSEEIPVIKGPRNDWWFLTTLVKNYGLSIVVAGDQIQIRDPVKAFKDRLNKQRVFALKGKFDPAKGVFPILGFNSPTTAVFLQPGVGSVQSNDVTTNKQDSNVTVDTDSVDTGTGTEGIKPADATENTAEGGIDAGALVPVDPESNHSEAIKGAYINAKTNKGVEINVETVGIPDLLPEEICYITGFSADGVSPGLYDGEYRILEVAQNIGSGGFTTTFKALGASESLTIKQILEDSQAETALRDAKPVNPSTQDMDAESNFDSRYSSRRPTIEE